MNPQIYFYTDINYVDRKTKAFYVFNKYQSILKGMILDVGADHCYLKKHIGDGGKYFGIGLHGTPDIQINLEQHRIPFKDNVFDCVICADVLEHLDNIHFVFDELCRVSRQWIILSLPSPWKDFYHMLRYGYYSPGKPMKYYHLPPEPPIDRHKWFFSTEEGKEFISYRAKLNQFNIIQMDVQGRNGEIKGIKGTLRRYFLPWIFKKSVGLENLYSGTLWAVLEKK